MLCQWYMKQDKYIFFHIMNFYKSINPMSILLLVYFYTHKYLLTEYYNYVFLNFFEHIALSQTSILLSDS